jgi:hypothetical protein
MIIEVMVLSQKARNLHFSNVFMSHSDSLIGLLHSPRACSLLMFITFTQKEILAGKIIKALHGVSVRTATHNDQLTTFGVGFSVR